MNQFYLLSTQICVLLVATDALVNIVPLAQLLHSLSKKEKSLLLIRENFLTIPTMFFLYFLMKGAIHVLNTPMCAILVAGGLVIILSGMRAMLGCRKDNVGDASRNFIYIAAPIATPLIIGPSWVAACCILISQQLAFELNAFVILCSWIGIFLFTMFVQLGLSGRKNSMNILLSIQTILSLFVTVLGSQLLISGLQKTFL